MILFFLFCSDRRSSTEETRKVLDILGLEHATEEDCVNVKLVCARVSTRAAFLVSAGIVFSFLKNIFHCPKFS